MECKVLITRDGKNIIESREYKHELLTDSELTWIHFRLGSREEIAQIHPSEMISEALLERLKNPGSSFLLERFGQVKLLDCNISYDVDDPVDHYLTFVILPEIVVTVSTLKSKLTDEISPERLIDTGEDYTSSRIILALLRRMLDKNTGLASEINRKVDIILKDSIARSFKTRTDEIERLHTVTIDLSELFEDQLATIRLLPINIEQNDENEVSFLDRIEKSMEHLVDVMDRAQEKLDYIFQRYTNMLQQKGNARLNTLTIIQAIFVPLTFIAGIYGMNFVNMPELEWEYGYLYVWILMGFIGIGSLYLFYRNGWFK